MHLFFIKSEEEQIAFEAEINRYKQLKIGKGDPLLEFSASAKATQYVSSAIESKPGLGMFKTFADEPREVTLWRFWLEWGKPGWELVSFIPPSRSVNTTFVFAPFRTTESNIDYEYDEMLEWESHLIAMRRCITLWGHLERMDFTSLESLFDQFNFRSACPEVYHKSDINSGSERLISPGERDEAYDHFRPNDFAGVAYTYLLSKINTMMAPHVRPMMLFTTTEYQSHEDPPPLQLKIVPKDFLGGIWLQFAEAVEAVGRLLTCPVCGNWFEIRPPATRNSRRYCSDACRARFRDTAKKQAITLHINGLTANQIADSLGIDLRTVKTFIQSTAEAEKKRRNKRRKMR
jgi:hypothetical protein